MPAPGLVTAMAELVKGLLSVIGGSRFRAQRAGGALHMLDKPE
jgi:hypothetical protein